MVLWSCTMLKLCGGFMFSLFLHDPLSLSSKLINWLQSSYKSWNFFTVSVFIMTCAVSRVFRFSDIWIISWGKPPSPPAPTRQTCQTQQSFKQSVLIPNTVSKMINYQTSANIWVSVMQSYEGVEQRSLQLPPLNVVCLWWVQIIQVWGWKQSKMSAAFI